MNTFNFDPPRGAPPAPLPQKKWLAPDIGPDELPPWYTTTRTHTILSKWYYQAHYQRRMAAISAPPGFGKSKSGVSFDQAHPGEIFRITLVPGSGHKNQFLREMAQTLLNGTLRGIRTRTVHQASGDYRALIYELICEHVGLSERDIKLKRYDRANLKRICIFVDEAQYLQRKTLDHLRCYGDALLKYTPVRIAFIFVGNDEFVLLPSDNGASPISLALGDRLLINKRLDYTDLAIEDVELVMDSMATLSGDARDFLLSLYSQNGAMRSLRFLEDLFEWSGLGSVDAPLALEEVGKALGRLADNGRTLIPAFSPSPEPRPRRRKPN
jgi:hypothetical protein